MAACVAITGSEDELLGASGADGSDGSLVVLDNELCRHVMRLIHQPEDDIRIAGEALGKFTPKCTKLSGGSGSRIRCITDDASSRGLLRRIVVAHVVMRVQEGVSTLSGNIVDCIGIEAIVCLSLINSHPNQL